MGRSPYIITKKMNDLLYLVKKSPKQALKAFHIDRLLPYRGQNLPKWFKSNTVINILGGINCVKALSTFPFIVYSDVNKCRN